MVFVSGLLASAVVVRTGTDVVRAVTALITVTIDAMTTIIIITSARVAMTVVELSLLTAIRKLQCLFL